MNSDEYGKMDVVNNKRLIISLQYTKAKSNGVYILSIWNIFESKKRYAYISLAILSYVLISVHSLYFCIYNHFFVEPSTVY